MTIKVVIPIGGIGARLRPHTHSKPKPLVEVAGKPVLGHILDKLLEEEKKTGEKIEVVFAIGIFRDMISDYLKENYSGRLEYHIVPQDELKGQSWTVKLARQHISDDDSLVVWFVDTLSDASLDAIKTSGKDAAGLMFVKEVADPRRFGQVVVEEKNGQNVITKLAEKSDPPVSSLVNIGIYYVRRAGDLYSAIDKQVERGMMKNGEYFLTDAFNILIQEGKIITAPVVNEWIDCGTPEAMIEANRLVLRNQYGSNFVDASTKLNNCSIVPPVYVNKNCTLANCVIGPYVSIGENVSVENCIIKDCIVHKNSDLRDINLKESIIGSDVYLKGNTRKINIGDNSEIEL